MNTSYTTVEHVLFFHHLTHPLTRQEIKQSDIGIKATTSAYECSRDEKEFSFASQHFLRLLDVKSTLGSQVLQHKVLQVDVIVYKPNHPITKNYHTLKDTFLKDGKDHKEVLVFHGTDVAAINAIIGEGLLVVMLVVMFVFSVFFALLSNPILPYPIHPIQCYQSTNPAVQTCYLLTTIDFHHQLTYHGKASK